jgi:hypothetical protein
MFNLKKTLSIAVPIPILAMVLISTAHCGSNCDVVTTGLDTSFAMGSENSIAMGEAMGETFIAQDTLIQAVTVWRPGFANWEPSQLFVVGTDSSGTPDPGNIILVGPVVYNATLDSSHYVPMRFELNPPLSLPGKGTYEIATLGVPCDMNYYVAINATNAYPSGKFWLHYRSAISGCRVRGVRVGVDSYDMIFSVEYCEPTTPAQPSTWGALRAKYR